MGVESRNLGLSSVEAGPRLWIRRSGFTGLGSGLVALAVGIAAATGAPAAATAQPTVPHESAAPAHADTAPAPAAIHFIYGHVRVDASSPSDCRELPRDFFIQVCVLAATAAWSQIPIAAADLGHQSVAMTARLIAAIVRGDRTICADPALATYMVNGRAVGKTADAATSCEAAFKQHQANGIVEIADPTTTDNSTLLGVLLP